MINKLEWVNTVAEKHLTKATQNPNGDFEELLESVINKEAREYPQDVSREQLETLYGGGYVQVTWKRSPNAVDSKCVGLDGHIWSVDDFLRETQHDAPIYSKSHVGCRCSLIIDGENLDPVEIFALR